MNFTFDEYERSNTAIKNGIDNHMSTNIQRDNFMRLVVHVLQPLRDRIQKPVCISSGFRCDELNRLVCKEQNLVITENSQHKTAEAVDIYVQGYTALQLCSIIRNMNIPFDQLIVYKSKGFCHISYTKYKNRKEVLYV